MNVLHYFIGSPDIPTPPIIIHESAHPDTPSPEELAALMEKWQNPTYPDDAYFTEDMFNAEARAKTMARAQDPGVMLCLLDVVDSNTHPLHDHTYSECFDYRSKQDISPKDPWTYWALYDSFPFGPPPVIIPPNPPHGWTPIARVNPAGISQMNGWSAGWQGYSFATQIGPSKILTGWGLGRELRVSIAAQATFGSLYIGPATSTPFLASVLYRLSFGGQNTGIVVDGNYNQNGFYTRISDPLLQEIEAPNGLIVCGYVSGPAPAGGYGWMQTRGLEQDWSCRYIKGDHAADLDKSKLATNIGASVISGWYPGGVSDLAVLMVEALY